MKPFDVLDANAPIFGSKLLEASAGTGKTFAIEHLFVRHLIEAPENEQPLQLTEILAITFTRAATRELKERIRTRIQHALASSTVSSVRRRLEEAMIHFDRAEIHTIHGFCQKMLSEFCLEARLLPEQEPAPFKQTLFPYILDFLESQTALCPEQLSRLMRQDSIQDLAKRLLEASCPEDAGSFAEDCRRFAEAAIPLSSSLQEEYERVKPSCKTSKMSLYDMEQQLDALRDHRIEPLLAAETLIFDFVAPENRKGKKEIATPLFDALRIRLLPLLKEARDEERLFERLRFAWEPKFLALVEEKGLFSPDMLLQRMARAVCEEPFCKAVQQKFRAAIIDEFQDTDELQWKIFETLFVRTTMRSLILVGDPKQSIYRFRKADLYTYYRAKELLGESAHYSLDTNYRSTPALLSALNDLFGEEKSEPWLLLPRYARAEPYRPVLAGKEIHFDSGDGKGALHFFTDAMSLADEILRLRPHVKSFGSFAVLIKDRYQGLEVQEALQQRAIPCSVKNQLPLGQAPAARALLELFELLATPRDESRLKIFQLGPFAGEARVYEWKRALEQEGLAPFLSAFLAEKMQPIRERGLGFLRDLFQIVEQLLEIQRFSYEAVRRFFLTLQCADPDEQSEAKRRIENDEEAVQIMTMHASKGLEFEIVFALGAAAASPKAHEDKEEIDAEKLRQLYVALTRAKLRLYLPLPVPSPSGKESPLEQFFLRSKLGREPHLIAAELAKTNPHITIETGTAVPVCIDPIPEQESIVQPPPQMPSLQFPRRTLLSFTSLTKSKAVLHKESAEAAEEGLPTLHNLPKGKETGVLLHKVFERAAFESTPIPHLIQEVIGSTPLQPWLSVLEDLVSRSLQLPLIDNCCFQTVNKRAEIEFLFPTHSMIKGTIDLLFEWQSKVYLLDWKTNWLGPDASYYSEEHLRRAMDEGHYWLQASLYKEALRSAWPSAQFGGAIYWFLRGLDAQGHGCLFFDPEQLGDVWT